MNTEERVAAAIAVVPELHGGRVMERLGGITNVNVKVESPNGTFVVRIDAPDEDVLEIDRTNELANCEAAAAAGVGAIVVARLPEQGVLITRFLEGHRLTPEDLRHGDRLADLAALLRRLHNRCRFRRGIDMFERQRGYQAIALARGCRLPEDYRRYEWHVERIRKTLAAHPVGLVACHNDLVAENMIDTPQGLRLIDFEYSGRNDPYSDLGDAWAESHLWHEQLEQLVAHYHGEPTPALVARARLWALVSKYGWTLWAVLRHQLTHDPELEAWGLRLYREAAAAFESDEFQHLLLQVAATNRAVLQGGHERSGRRGSSP
jgi:thiamine kinase-like enzyme